MNYSHFRGNLGVAVLRGASTCRSNHEQAMRKFNVHAEKSNVWKANRQRSYKMDIRHMEFQRNLRMNRAWVESFAMRMAIDYEISHGAHVVNVSIPVKARQNGFADYPGFDLVSHRPFENIRYIEVKGHDLESNGINLTENEWMSAENLRKFYWVYEVINCGTNWPQLFEMQDPFLYRLRRGFDIR